MGSGFKRNGSGLQQGVLCSGMSSAYRKFSDQLWTKVSYCSLDMVSS